MEKRCTVNLLTQKQTLSMEKSCTVNLTQKQTLSWKRVAL